MQVTNAPDGFVDGESIPHTELQRRLGFKHVLNCKRWVQDNDLPYASIGNLWWLRTDDVRAKMAELAKPHAAHRAERSARRQRKPSK